VASVRSYRKLPSCLTESIPAGSKTYLLLAKAKTIRDGGSTSGIMYLRGKNTCITATAVRERSKNM